MTTYTVTVTRTISADVEVEAETPEEAAAQVNKRSFTLPPLEEWQGMKDWTFTVYDGDTLIDAYEGDDLIDQALVRPRLSDNSLACIDCGSTNTSGPDFEGFIDCHDCGAANIPGSPTREKHKRGVPAPPVNELYADEVPED